MKKLIFILIIGLLVFFTYQTVVNGFDSSFLKIPSYKDLQNGNEKLDQGIAELNSLINKDYSDRIGIVATAKSNFNQQKQLKLDL